MFNVSIFGLGQFGFAIAKHLCRKYCSYKGVSIRGFEVDNTVNNSIKRYGFHPYHFQKTRITKKLEIVESLEDLLKNTDLLIMAIPAQTIRGNIRKIRPLIQKDILILNVAKALESDSDKIMSEVISEELLNLKHKISISTLNGGMIASEFINDSPVGCDIACKNLHIADLLRDFFSDKFLRAYSTEDIKGVEYAGAIKNVIAIGAGICDGLGLPLSSKTFMIARAAKEGSMLGISLGANEATFSASSQCWGSDLNLSCMGNTRNRLFGEMIGKGNKVKDVLKILESEHKIAEGYLTTKVLQDLEKIKNLNLPIIDSIYHILYHNKDPLDSIQELMKRDLKRVDQ